ncbi:BMP and activin membrane-bound inhibitor homolog [Polistes fuscatus]|uniref:BMP and activin membrane-bound inhibitor homolog n=1 Tax=Polistes fuscatus TaxID=30207 RepID=UPI001CA8D1DE|nr:BMP and activin membrane-bound inhibitor homolog [Polistes fuscatus]
MLSWDLSTIVMIMATINLVYTNGASIDFDSTDYDGLSENEEKSSNDKELSVSHEVRCYCNQPDCVPQGYMCRGKSCFTEIRPNVGSPLLSTEHITYSGCFDQNFKEPQCPAGFICCEQDLCNHVDSPEMRNTLNKTIQMILDEQRTYLGPVQPTGHGSQSSDNWFKTATIAVPIGGIIALLILASLAIRFLKPVPLQSDKLGGHRTADNGPPLLGPAKVPLV